MKQRIKWLFVIAVFFLTVSAIVFAGTVGDVNGDGHVGLAEAIHALQVMSGLTPKTALDECITCEGTLNGTRWCDQLNGTVKDMTTGLVWLKDAGYMPKMEWLGANEIVVEELGDGYYGNINDGSVLGEWRLPTIEEFIELSNGPEAVNFSNQRAFSNIVEGRYWSSTTRITAADWPYPEPYHNLNAYVWWGNGGYGHDYDYYYKDGVYNPDYHLNEFGVWPVRSDN